MEQTRTTEIRVLLSTCPEGEAEKLARFLVEGRHAACVSIVPQVTSVYRWEGKIHRDEESLLVIKCAASRASETVRALADRHPYDVPEVLALQVADGHRAYIDWVLGSSGATERG